MLVLALNFCIMLIFLLRLNLIFANGFLGAEVGTYEFSTFQVGVFDQAYQTLKDDQGV